MQQSVRLTDGTAWLVDVLHGSAGLPSPRLAVVRRPKPAKAPDPLVAELRAATEEYEVEAAKRGRPRTAPAVLEAYLAGDDEARVEVGAWEREQLRLEAKGRRGLMTGELRARILGAVGDLVSAEAARTERVGLACSPYVVEVHRLLVSLLEDCQERERVARLPRRSSERAAQELIEAQRRREEKAALRSKRSELAAAKYEAERLEIEAQLAVARRYCPRGHDKDATGRRARGSCRACEAQREQSRTLWTQEQRERDRRRARLRERERARTDPGFRVLRALRARMHKAVRGPKSARSLELIGCSVAELWDHLERQFKPGMTRENYGLAWQVDHVRPCAAFDLTDPAQQRECFHFSNLQPLWSEENASKCDKLPDGSRARATKKGRRA